MKRSYLSKVISAGVVVASCAVLPLAVPSAARSENMSNYEMRRHEGRSDTMMISNMQAQATQDRSMMNSYNIEDQWLSAREFYRLGYHEWRGEGMMSNLRTSPMQSSSMMMQRQTITTPSTQNGNMMMQPGSTMNQGTTTNQDTTINQDTMNQTTPTQGMDGSGMTTPSTGGTNP
jgi:hypothetical protein